MRVTRRVVAILVLAVIGVVLIVALAAWPRAGSKASAQKSQATPSPRATASLVAVSTVDYARVYPEQTLASISSTQANAAMLGASAASTQARATQLAFDMALRAGTPTAQALVMGQTADAQSSQATYRAVSAALSAQQTAVAVDKAADVERRARNRADAAFYGGWVVIGVAAAIAALWAVNRSYAATMQRAMAAAAESPLDHLEPVTDGFVQVSPGRHHTSRLPVDDETFAVWASRMLAGETAGINQWEDADSPFVGKRAAYDPFLAEMEQRGYVGFVSGRGKVLTETGEGFCRGWLARKGYDAPPPAGFAPETEQNAMNHAIPYPQSDGGGGEEDEE